jgi:hypothetical protein
MALISIFLVVIFSIMYGASMLLVFTVFQEYTTVITIKKMYKVIKGDSNLRGLHRLIIFVTISLCAVSQCMLYLIKK